MTSPPPAVRGWAAPVGCAQAPRCSPRGEFALVIIGLVGASYGDVEAVATPCVFILAIAGPTLARFTGGRPVPVR